MNKQKDINYHRIAQAIEFIKANFKEQPDLDEVAKMINLSPYHFQRLFSEWAGTSPKKFLQYTTLEYAKRLLKENKASLWETTYEAGLSGTGRLHDLFINIEGMSPAEYKNGGKNLSINYSFAKSPFGDMIVASTKKGICYMAFVEDKQHAFITMQNMFPNADFRQAVDLIQQNALYIFNQDRGKINEVKLHLKGSDFQLKVWQAILSIPMGTLASYGEIAIKIDHKNASRAVGTAIGSNPVAFLIPCHRVIQASGGFGGYMWGTTRKAIIIGYEGAKLNSAS